MTLAARRTTALRELPRPSAGPLATIAERVILKGLGLMSLGGLEVTLPDGTVHRFGDLESGEWQRLEIVRDDFFRRLALRGRVGFGEAWVAGDFQTDDLPGLIALLGRNIEVARERDPLKTITRITSKRPRLGLPNTARRAERKIHYHYDLGNDLYKLFLDESLTYSCAIFEHEGQSLADAQQAKYRRICDRLDLGPGDRVLEIGCGWGGFALHAARERGCHVTGITISREQHDEAQQRVREAGLSEHVSIEYRDFREVEGTYTHVVSIEMFEAIGESLFEPYFQTLDRVLEPGGRALVQTIALPEQRYATYRRTRDFIQAYIFPGGHLPSLEVMLRAMRRSSRLHVQGLEEIGPHYAETLRLWRETFHARIDEVRALGYDERFVRIWDYYLSFCEAGFRERILRDVQVVLARPGR
jgi:cyclopropane-fatty-acyl-phospholipid synthase